MTDGFMAVQFHWPALTAAWALSVYGLYLLVQVVRRIRVSDRDVGTGWWLGGALCIGTGIWAESFLGLVAMQLPIKVGYVPSVVLASWLPSVVISGAVIWLLSQVNLGWRERVVGGTLFGIGFGLLVVVDVAAMVFQPQVVWDSRLVIAGCLVVALGCVAGSVLIRRELAQPPS